MASNIVGSKILAAVGVLALLAVGFFFVMAGNGNGTDEEEETPDANPRVTLIQAGSVGGETEVSTVGEVRSVSEATLRAKRTGEITRLSVEPGARVSAGTILAQMENATELAQVEQARASLQAQEAALAKTISGTRQEQLDILDINVTNADQALAEAKATAVNAYKSTFTLAADAVLSKADNFFRDPRTARPNFIPNSANYDESIALENDRVAIGQVLTLWSARAQSISTGADLDEELDVAEDSLKKLKHSLIRLVIL